MYYRGAAGAVLVFDITDLTSFHAVKGWIKGLSRHCCSSLLHSFTHTRLAHII